MTASTDVGLRTEDHGDVVRFVLDRAAKRNALTREMLAALRDGLRAVRQAGRARVVVLAAEGPVFCAGMDLGQMQAAAADPNATAIWQGDADVYQSVVQELFTMPMVTLAVAQGTVVAGGVGLVLACDLALAGDAAGFQLPEPKRGITASMVTPLLVYRVGAGRASSLLLAGELIDSATAAQWGLIHERVADEQLAHREGTLIESILHSAPQALAATKEQLRQCAGAVVIDQLATSARQSATARGTPEAREGLQAFLEHRKPGWCPP
ncbi:MAG TPA: enoyl-CoA hydratase-related protein [Planctomycetaceae bacterium]|nr:enoyl-CoA hydratase-related protein [Planctomycetaceae bacterium]